jgi:ABC-type sulfate/molybdate transport systems ATPase subunit
LREVQEGHVRVQGQLFVDTAQGICLPPHRRGVGYVPQHQALFPFLDVAANVGFGLPRGERRGPRVVRLLQELGIAHLSSAIPSSLSGGERQRVALARALAVEPRLLLLDEPFASLDRAAAATLRVLVSEVVRRHHIPTLLVTHDADEAVAMGDRVVRFEAGRTVEAGRPAEVLARGEVTVRGRIERVEVEEGVARAGLRDAVVEGAVGALREGAVEVQGQVARRLGAASGTDPTRATGRGE